MTPREVSAWLMFALDGERKDEAKRLRLYAVASQGDNQAIQSLLRELQD